ncbi:hypothetical protein, partial [Paracoccus sp. (in: a-proteobacteria)]|uniref:hypothetical protein n=1 Tax=Paracoccus sp. TaxID=267 RepID=UPI0035B0B534
SRLIPQNFRPKRQAIQPVSPSPPAFPPSVKRYLRRQNRKGKSLSATFFAEPSYSYQVIDMT